MFVNIFYIPPPNGGRAKGPEIFSKKTLRPLFKKSLTLWRHLIILKNIKNPFQKIPESFDGIE
jgi:hypothetical protein